MNAGDFDALLRGAARQLMYGASGVTPRRVPVRLLPGDAPPQLHMQRLYPFAQVPGNRPAQLMKYGAYRSGRTHITCGREFARVAVGVIAGPIPPIATRLASAALAEYSPIYLVHFESARRQWLPVIADAWEEFGGEDAAAIAMLRGEDWPLIQAKIILVVAGIAEQKQPPPPRPPRRR